MTQVEFDRLNENETNFHNLYLAETNKVKKRKLFKMYRSAQLVKQNQRFLYLIG
jgi:hypothetical protein